MLLSVNPSNGIELARFEESSKEKIHSIVDNAHETWTSWRQTTFEKRAMYLSVLGDILDKRKDEIAPLITIEMGKPLSQSRVEVDKCSGVCRYYARYGNELLQNKSISTEYSKSYISYQPLGVLLAIMPWNFPFWQVFRFLAPNLMAGNAIILKHASNVQGCAIMIEAIIKQAGFPENLFNNISLPSKRIKEVIRHPLIRGVTLTGSREAGRSAAKLSGESLKKIVLELGGSDPYLILKDADLNVAVKACLLGRTYNNGQSCIAAKRIIIEEAVYDEFLNRLLDQMKKLVLGDPLEKETDIGPLINQKARGHLHEQVMKSIELGAECSLGGQILEGEGYFYPVTILSDVQPGMPAFDEELFGPVAALIRARDVDHAVELANKSDFGLGAAVFTKDLKMGNLIAEKQIDSGICFINDFVHSDPRLPFGGVKDSGYGRELSEAGIYEFVNTKTIVMK